MLDSGNVYRSEVIKEVSRLPCSHPASVNIDVANLYYSLTKMVLQERLLPSDRHQYITGQSAAQYL
jgi:hypothetical protein